MILFIKDEKATLKVAMLTETEFNRMREVLIHLTTSTYKESVVTEKLEPNKQLVIDKVEAEKLAGLLEALEDKEYGAWFDKTADQLTANGVVEVKHDKVGNEVVFDEAYYDSDAQEVIRQQTINAILSDNGYSVMF